MIELNGIEIEEVSGGMGLLQFASWANALLEFGTGWVDGVNAASGG